jgi:hypothetical protein
MALRNFNIYAEAGNIASHCLLKCWSVYILTWPQVYAAQLAHVFGGSQSRVNEFLKEISFSAYQSHFIIINVNVWC